MTPMKRVGIHTVIPINGFCLFSYYFGLNLQPDSLLYQARCHKSFPCLLFCSVILMHGVLVFLVFGWTFGFDDTPRLALTCETPKDLLFFLALV
jgi:hypothetical protein